MKKLLTFAILMIVFQTTYAQQIQPGPMFTDVSDSHIYDAYDGYAVRTQGQKVGILKRDVSGMYAVIHEDNLPEGIKRAMLNVKNDIVTVMVETPTRILGIRLTPSGTGHVAQVTDLTSMLGATDHHMIARRYPHGVSFLHQYRWTSGGPIITKMGTFNFDGTFVKNTATMDTSLRYTGIVSDQLHHYALGYLDDTTVLLERRNNDAILSYNNGYPLGPIYEDSTDLTDIMSDDTTIRFLVRDYSKNLIREKVLYKINGVSTEVLISHPVSSNTAGEEYISPMVLMVQNKVIQHQPVPYGPAPITNSATFPAGYTHFTSYRVSGYFFTWIGTSGPTVGGNIHMMLVDDWLSTKGSITLGASPDAFIVRGGYQQDTNTFIIFGDKISNGVSYGIIYTVILKNISTNINNVKGSDANITIYPNPTTDYIHLSSANDKITNVMVYDMRGASVKNIEVNDTKAQIGMQELPAGIYTLKVASQHWCETKRIIVK